MSKNTNLSFLTDYITADITNGRIGINNPSPSVAFDVTGAGKFSSSLTATGVNGAVKLTLQNSDNAGYLAFTEQDIRMWRPNGSGADLSIATQAISGSLGSGAIIFQPANTERMRILSGGNVGIGTTTPGQKLDVNGNIRAAGAFVQATGNIYVGDWVGFFDVSTSTSKVYLLQLVPTETIPLLNYRLFGVIQTNTTSGTYYFTSISSQTMEVRFVGNTIQARITNGNGYYFNWSITQLC